jgi:uncharacterized membrane protein
LATLLVIGYREEITAAKAAEELRRLRQTLLIHREAVAVVARDTSGGYRVKTSHHPVDDCASWGMFWGLLYGLLFFVPEFGATVGTGLGGLFATIEQSGIHRAFQQQARDMVRPGTSALCLVAERVEPEKVLAALAKFGGTRRDRWRGCRRLSMAAFWRRRSSERGSYRLLRTQR